MSDGGQLALLAPDLLTFEGVTAPATVWSEVFAMFDGEWPATGVRILRRRTGCGQSAGWSAFISWCAGGRPQPVAATDGAT